MNLAVDRAESRPLLRVPWWRLLGMVDTINVWDQDSDICMKTWRETFLVWNSNIDVIHCHNAPDSYVWSQAQICLSHTYQHTFMYGSMMFVCSLWAYGIWPFMSESRHLCLKPHICFSYTYQHTFLSVSIHSYVWPIHWLWNLTIYVWNQTLMSETIPISLGHTYMYEFYSHICMETAHLCVRSYIHVWARHISVSDSK